MVSSAGNIEETIDFPGEIRWMKFGILSLKHLPVEMSLE